MPETEDSHPWDCRVKGFRHIEPHDVATRSRDIQLLSLQKRHKISLASRAGESRSSTTKKEIIDLHQVQSDKHLEPSSSTNQEYKSDNIFYELDVRISEGCQTCYEEVDEEVVDEGEIHAITCAHLSSKHYGIQEHQDINGYHKMLAKNISTLDDQSISPQSLAGIIQLSILQGDTSSALKIALSAFEASSIFELGALQFLQRAREQKDGQSMVAGRLQVKPLQLELVFANAKNMASVVGVGLPIALVTLKGDTMKVHVRGIDDNECVALWGTKWFPFKTIVAHHSIHQSERVAESKVLSAYTMAQQFGVGFKIGSSDFEGSYVVKQDVQRVQHNYKLHELAKIWLLMAIEDFIRNAYMSEYNLYQVLGLETTSTTWNHWTYGLYDLWRIIGQIYIRGSRTTSGSGGTCGRANSDDGHSGGAGERDVDGSGSNDNNGGGSPPNNAEASHQDKEIALRELVVEVHPGHGSCYNSEYPKPINGITIQPTITLHFRKIGASGTREIHSNLLVNFGLGNARPDSSKNDHFAWYQEPLKISLQCLSHGAARIKHDTVNILGIEDVREGHNTTFISSMNPVCTTIGGEIALKAPTFATGKLQVSRTSTSTPCTSTQELWTREVRAIQLPNGFTPVPTTDGGFQPHISCTFEHVESIPHNVLYETSRRKYCAAWSICGSLMGNIEGTWQGLNEEEACLYQFRSERCLKGLFWSEPTLKQTSRNILKRKKKSEPKLEERCITQNYEVELYINHAMSHLHKFDKFVCVEPGGIVPGVLSVVTNIPETNEMPLITT